MWISPWCGGYSRCATVCRATSSVTALSCGFLARLRRFAVLVDDAAADPSPVYRCVDRDDHAPVVVGWMLVEALVWTMPVEVLFVLPQDNPGRPFVIGQHSVGAFGSDAPHEAFRERVSITRR